MTSKWMTIREARIEHGLPVGMQLMRTPGFNLQRESKKLNGLDAVVVTRASKKWGNPYHVGMFRGYSRADAVRDFKKWLAGDHGARAYAGAPPTKAEIRKELGGKNLACACPVDGEPCHRDVYLRIANT